MDKNLIVQTRVGIGDFCMFLPFVKIISQKNNCKYDVIAKKRSCAKQILKYEKNLENVLYVENKIRSYKIFFKIIRLIKKNNYKNIYIFHFGIIYSLLNFIFPKKKIYYYGAFKKKVKIFYFAKTKVSQWLNINNNFDHNKFLNLNFIQRNISKKKLIIGIGGSGNSKKWNIKNYIRLIKHLSGKRINFIIAGGKNELEDFENIKSECRDESLINLCEKKIEDCIEIMNGSIGYVGNDTGFMHIAALLNITSVGLFGDNPNDYASYNSKIIKILPENFSDPNYNKELLMNGIKYDQVLKIFLKNLSL